jgi:hypothetical protein
MRPIPLVPALLLTASAAMAAETHDVDLRLNVAAAPGIDKVEVKDSADANGNPVPSANGSFDFDAKYGISFEPSVMFRAGWHGIGIVGGPGLFLTNERGEHQTTNVLDKRRMVAYGLQLQLGPSFQWDWLRLEILPTLGLGAAHATSETIISGKNAREHSDDAFYLQYGIRGGLYADNDQGLVGLQVGWQSFRTEVKFAAMTSPFLRDSDTETLSGSGIYAAFVAGVAF